MLDLRSSDNNLITNNKLAQFSVVIVYTCESEISYSLRVSRIIIVSVVSVCQFCSSLFDNAREKNLNILCALIPKIDHERSLAQSSFKKIIRFFISPFNFSRISRAATFIFGTMFSALIFKEPPKPSRSGFKSSLNLYHLSEWMPNFCNRLTQQQ